MSYRLNSPQALSTASSNETHWFGCDLKSPDSRTMWKRTYGSLCSSPTFLNNLGRTLSILSPLRTRQLDRRDVQLLVPGGFSILSVLWKNRKSPLARCCCEVKLCNFISIISQGSLPCRSQLIIQWHFISGGWFCQKQLFDCCFSVRVYFSRCP